MNLDRSVKFLELKCSSAGWLRRTALKAILRCITVPDGQSLPVRQFIRGAADDGRTRGRYGSGHLRRRRGDARERALRIGEQPRQIDDDVRRETHAIHHASTGNLDRRGIGDLPTLTVVEYRAKGPVGRGLYRIVRHPLFLFGVVPFYSFFLQNRLPVGLMQSGWKYWLSAMATNAAIAAILAALVWFGGWNVVLFIFFPTMLLGASTGMWFFYVQHQFEHTSWNSEADWSIQNAALKGSSHYDLPPILRWITGNIGVHHVHHLASRIPFYRLPEVLRDHYVLANSNRVTMRESLSCARLALWDQSERRLVTFAEARRLPA